MFSPHLFPSPLSACTLKVEVSVFSHLFKCLLNYTGCPDPASAGSQWIWLRIKLKTRPWSATPHTVSHLWAPSLGFLQLSLISLAHTLKTHASRCLRTFDTLLLICFLLQWYTPWSKPTWEGCHFILHDTVHCREQTRQGLEAETMEEGCSLDCILWLAQLAL